MAKINHWICLIFLSFGLSYCEKENPFRFEKLIDCPAEYSRNELISYSAIPFPEDVIIYGKVHNKYSQFYQIDEKTDKTVLYGFELNDKILVSNFFNNLNLIGIDTSITYFKSGHTRISFSNEEGCRFEGSLMSLNKLQMITYKKYD